MVENIINNINNNDLMLKINNQLKENSNYINNFIKSSPYAYSIFLNNPELLDYFFQQQNIYIKNSQNIITYNQNKKEYISSDDYFKTLLEKYPEIKRNRIILIHSALDQLVISPEVSP